MRIPFFIITFARQLRKSINLGEVLEWLKRHAWKACNRQNRFAGSNPVLSARKGFKAFLRQRQSFARKGFKAFLRQGNLLQEKDSKLFLGKRQSFARKGFKAFLRQRQYFARKGFKAFLRQKAIFCKKRIQRYTRFYIVKCETGYFYIVSFTFFVS